MNDLFDTVAALVAEVTKGTAGQITPETRLRDVPGLDSLAVMETVAACEARWQIEIDEEELLEVTTMADLCVVIAGTMP